jgi:putative ABC transport system ATP-binding protein
VTSLLTAVHVSRQFGAGADSICALSNVSVDIKRGEFVALEGPSGCGKSTLLHLLAGLDVPSQGTVRFAEMGSSPAVVLNELDDSARSRFRLEHIGMVLPVVDLISALSSWENVALPLLLAGKKLSSGRARAESLLADVGLSHRVSVGAGRLSTGEAQRVSLARALFHEPSLLLADEPTSFLDSVRSDEVLRLLRTLADGGQTIVMATHDPRAAAYADRSLRLLDGEVVELPSHQP